MEQQNNTFNPLFGELTENETAVLVNLLKPGTMQDVADRAGVSRSTVYRYLADPRFQSALRSAQKTAIESAISLLSGEARDAAQTLVTIHKDPAVADGTRVQAARYCLTENLRIIESHEMLERIEEIERQLGIGM